MKSWLQIKRTGSLTMTRNDLERVELNQTAATIFKMSPSVLLEDIDLAFDPPPDLVLEVEYPDLR